MANKIESVRQTLLNKTFKDPLKSMVNVSMKQGNNYDSVIRPCPVPPLLQPFMENINIHRMR